MQILDRYILKEFLGPFLFSLTAFVAVWLGTGPAYYIAQMMGKYNAPWSMAAQLVVYTLPVAIYAALPVAMLLGSILAFGKLSASSEITAMKAGGVSFARIVAPVLVFSMCMTIANFIIGQYLMPLGNEHFNTVVNYDIKRVVTPRNHEDNMVVQSNMGDEVSKSNIVLYAREYDPVDHRLKNVTVQGFGSSGQLSWFASADWAEYIDANWILHDGNGYEIAFDQKIVRNIRFDKQTVVGEGKQQIKAVIDKNFDELTLEQLRQKTDLFKREGRLEYRVLETELYGRTAISFACLIVALIGPPLALRSSRGGSSAGIGAAFGVTLVYFGLYYTGAALSKSGKISAIAAAVIPDVVGLTTGILLTLRANRK